MRILKIVLCITLIMFFLNIVAYADDEEMILVEQHVIETDEVNITTDKMVNGGTYAYAKPSPTYEFLDENGIYNVVYTSEDNVYWEKFNDNFESINKVSMPMVYHKENVHDFLKDITFVFGNSIYKDGYLYVVYGNTVSGSKFDNVFEKALALVKYDSNGNMIDKNEVNAMGVNLTGTDYNYSAYNLFYGSVNCVLTVSDDNILTVFMGYMMFNQHHASVTMYFDLNTLNELSEYYGENKVQKYVDACKDLYTSHSFDQRIITLENGDIVEFERCDASPRGIVVTKLKDTGELISRNRFVLFHFRETPDASYGYNNTYNVMGNVIEVSDGLLYIGASEKTLDIGQGKNINESWEIYAQKIRKDFENYTNISDIAMFDGIRECTGEKFVPEHGGRVFLNGTEKDYGIKWLTNSNNEYITLDLRAVKIEDGKILILYDRIPIKEYYYDNQFYGYTRNGSQDKVYYMIIDEDANVVQSPKEIMNANISILVNYVYKDNSLIWSTTDGNSKKIVINKLSLEKNQVIQYTILETVKNDNKEYIFIDSKNAQNKVLVKENFPMLELNGYSMRGMYINSNNEYSYKNYSSYIGSKDRLQLINSGYDIVKEYIAIVKGDISGNGLVKIYDAFQILKGVLSNDKLSLEDTLIRDFNGDRNVQIYDAFQFLKEALK